MADPDTVTLSRAEYEDLVDARDHAVAMRHVAIGAMATIADADMDAYLAAPLPLAFWRKQRGMELAALAAAVGLPEAALAQVEQGQTSEDLALHGHIARVLRIRVDDLAPQ